MAGEVDATATLCHRILDIEQHLKTGMSMRIGTKRTFFARGAPPVSSALVVEVVGSGLSVGPVLRSWIRRRS